MCLFHDWESFFSPNPKPNSYISKNSQLEAKDFDYHVSKCIFNEIKNGSIRITTTIDSIKLLVDTTSFTNCSISNANGGCLYYSSAGQCIQDRITSYNSKISKMDIGMHSYVIVSPNAPNNNSLFDSAVSKSGGDAFQGIRNIYSENGKITLQRVNISDTKNYGGCIFCFSNYLSNSIVKSSLFASNKDASKDDYAPIACFDSPFEFEIISTNFLNNSDEKYLIYARNSSFLFNYCCFINNSLPKYFFFCLTENDKIHIRKCYISTENPININNVIITDRIEMHSNKLSCNFEMKTYLVIFRNTLHFDLLIITINIIFISDLL